MESVREEKTAEYSPGGSALLRPTRNRKPKQTQAQLNTTALQAITKKLGEEESARLRTQFKSLVSTKFRHQDWETGNGIVLSLIRQGCSVNGIRQLLGVGASRVKRISDQSTGQRPPKRERGPPIHAATEEDLKRIKKCAAEWELEDGFPCAHRRPRQYFIEENMR